jgi:hypothetical protein
MTAKIAIIIACCCVLEIDETNSPGPNVERIDKKAEKKRNRTLPLTEIPEITFIAMITFVIETNQSITNGIGLPIIS